MIRVFKAHRLVAEYPTGHQDKVVAVLRALFPDPPNAYPHVDKLATYDPEDLLILSGPVLRRHTEAELEALIVAVHQHGEWDAAGEDIPCGWREPDPTCPNCNQLASRADDAADGGMASVEQPRIP